MARKKFLIIYGIVILILLIVILFIVPDKFFMKGHDDEEVKVPITEVAYEDQIKKLRNNKYDYNYLIMYDINYDESIYKCDGKIDGDKEEGSCTSPSDISYTEKNKSEVFKNIKLEYMDLNYIFDLVKDVEPKIENYYNTKKYIYNLLLDKVNSDITIYSAVDRIIEVELSNQYGSYVIKIKNEY